MRRRHHRPKAAETLKKKTDPQFGFTNPDASSSRAHSDLKRRRSVTFVDVDHHRSPLNDSPEYQTERSIDAKTSEFAFFKKFKSSFGICSESFDSNKCSNKVKTFESRSKPGGTDREAKVRCNSTNSFSTPIYNARRGSCGLSMSPVNLTRKDNEKDPGKSSSAFSRDKHTVPGGNNNLTCGGSSDEKEDLFTVKRKRLNQWVKDTWLPEISELTSNGADLVSVLLTRLFPGTDERHPSRFCKDRTDSVNTGSFLDSPGSKFLKKSHERYTRVDHSLQMEKDRSSIFWRGWLENSIAPSLQFATNHVHSSFIPRDPEDFSFSISYPKESVYRPPLLTQKPSLSFPVEETMDSSLHFRNYKSLSLGYHREDMGYSSENLAHDHREPSSALLLEWNAENESTRKTDDLPLNYHTKLITYPNASSSSLTDDPWSSDYSSSHDLVTRELYPLPLLSHYTSGSFLLPTTNKTSRFEHEFERHIIDDEDVVAANQNLQTFHHANSSADCLSRDYTYYHNLSNSPVDHCPFKSPGCEIVSFPISSISNSNLLKVSSPIQSDRITSHDLIPLKFQSPQAWINS